VPTNADPNVLSA